MLWGTQHLTETGTGATQQCLVRATACLLTGGIEVAPSVGVPAWAPGGARAARGLGEEGAGEATQWCQGRWPVVLMEVGRLLVSGELRWSLADER